MLTRIVSCKKLTYLSITFTLVSGLLLSAPLAVALASLVAPLVAPLGPVGLLGLKGLSGQAGLEIGSGRISRTAAPLPKRLLPDKCCCE